MPVGKCFPQAPQLLSVLDDVGVENSGARPAVAPPRALRAGNSRQLGFGGRLPGRARLAQRLGFGFGSWRGFRFWRRGFGFGDGLGPRRRFGRGFGFGDGLGLRRGLGNGFRFGDSFGFRLGNLRRVSVGIRNGQCRRRCRFVYDFNGHRGFTNTAARCGFEQYAQDDQGMGPERKDQPIGQIVRRLRVFVIFVLSDENQRHLLFPAPYLAFL